METQAKKKGEEIMSRAKFTIEKDGEVVRELTGDCAFGAVATDQGDGVTEQEIFIVGEMSPSELGIRMAKMATKVMDSLSEGVGMAFVYEMTGWLEEKNKKFKEEMIDEEDNIEIESNFKEWMKGGLKE